jgi:hypothetical protein
MEVLAYDCSHNLVVNIPTVAKSFCHVANFYLIALGTGACCDMLPGELMGSMGL